MDDNSIDVGDELDLMDWVPDKDMVSSLMSLSGWLSNSEQEPEETYNSTNSPMSGPNRFTDIGSAKEEGFKGLIVPGNYGMMPMESAVKKWIPDSIFNRKDKMGFPVPLTNWISKEPVRGFFHDTLLSKASKQRGLFNPVALENLIHRETNLPGQTRSEIHFTISVLTSIS